MVRQTGSHERSCRSWADYCQSDSDSDDVEDTLDLTGLGVGRVDENRLLALQRLRDANGRGATADHLVHALKGSEDDWCQQKASDIGSFINALPSSQRPTDAAGWADVLTSHLQPNRGIETTKLEASAAKDILDPIEPSVRILGHDEETGEPDIVIDISLVQSVRRWMRDHNLREDAFRDHPPYEGVIRDVRDGWRWRDDCHVRAGKEPLMFQQFTDAIECGDALKPQHGTHNVTVTMSSLLNWSSFIRTTPLDHIMITSICLTSVAKRYGLHDVISGQLDSNGEYQNDTSVGADFRSSPHIIDSISETTPIDFKLHSVTHDALGGAEASETKCSFSATTEHFCKQCDIPSRLRHIPCDFMNCGCPFMLRCHYSHLRDKEIVSDLPFASKWTGQNKRPAAYDGITPDDPFAVTECSPFDFNMHSEQTIFMQELQRGMRDKFFPTRAGKLQYHHEINNATDFNALLKSYKFPLHDRHTKPLKQSADAFKEGNHLLWTAAMTMTFAQHAERILGAAMDQRDPAWQCLLLHCDYIAFSRREWFHEDDVFIFNQMIYDHHCLFIEVYGGDAVIPKWHFVSHAPLDLVLFGPLWPNSCFRKEARLKIIKENFRGTNTKSRLLTVARRYCMHIALTQHDNKLAGVCMWEGALP
jgi:hypothetical protein